jgi:hypothetical protein
VGRYRRPSLYFESGDEREVKVRFTGGAAAIARDQWPERASGNADGSVTVAARFAPGNFILGWVLGYGGPAEVEAPPEVPGQLAARVGELEGLYQR